MEIAIGAVFIEYLRNIRITEMRGWIEMSKNEILNIVKKLQGGYIKVNLEDKNINYIDDFTIPILKNCDVDCFDLLRLSIPFERPDAYYLTSDGILYLIEHFEVDISKKDIKNSSPCKKEYSKADKKVKEVFSKDIDSFIHTEIKVEGTIQTFVDSISYALNNHYLKIQEYKNRMEIELKDKNIKDIKIIFLMENPMAFGSYYIEDDAIIDISLFEYTCFLSLLRDKIDVDYFMYFTHKFVSGNFSVLYIESQESLQNKIGKNIELDTDLSCNHIDMAAQIVITEEELRKNYL